jgi:hypothetical protein
MDNVAATFAMGVNDPPPAISGNGAAIAPRPATSTELVKIDAPLGRARNGRKNRGVLSPAGEQLGRIGYIPGGVEKFAAAVNKLIFKSRSSPSAK